MRGFGLVTALTAASTVLLGASPAGTSGWTVVPSPPSDGGFFNAVSARTDADAWAVGRATQSLVTSALAAHWNGTAWTVAATPHVANSVLTGVTDAWAVGNNAGGKAITENWTGRSWRVVPNRPPACCSAAPGPGRGA